MSFANIRYPTQIKFGWNSLDRIAQELKAAHKKKPLIVTDKNLTALKMFTGFTALLEENKVNEKQTQ